MVWIVCKYTGWIALLTGCSMADPDIPVGHSVAKPEPLPSYAVEIGTVTDNQAQIEITLRGETLATVSRLLFCYSLSGTIPDTTCLVEDITHLAYPISESSSFTLTNLDYSTEYTCCLYVENWKKSAYTQTKSFVTQADPSILYWDRVSEFSVNDTIFGRVCQTENRIFMFNLYTGQHLYTPVLWEYEPATNRFHNHGRHPIVAPTGYWLAIGDMLYAGFAEWYLGDQSWWCYDPSCRQWTLKKELERNIGEIIACFSIASKGYILAKSYEIYGNNEFFVFEYDPVNDSWQKKNPYPGMHAYNSTSVTVGGKAYVIGGLYYDPDKEEYVQKNTVWEYDPATDQWTEKALFPGSGTYNMLSCSSGESLYAGFGKENMNSKYVCEWWKYTPATNTWAECTTYSFWKKFSLFPQFVFSHSNQIYVGFSYLGLWKYNETPLIP